MPTHPAIFTPLRVLGVPDLQWRIAPGPGRGIVQSRLLPDGPWRDQDAAVVRAEIDHRTEVGHWLARMVAVPAPAADRAGGQAR
jgi:hypothetical protein